jgi:hypothetical protein
MMLALHLSLVLLVMGCDNSARSPSPTATGSISIVQTLSPTIELDPATGYAGTRVNARGSGWRPATIVTLKLADAQGSSPVLTASTVDAQGQFSTAFLYPMAERWLGAGAHLVVAAAAEDAEEVVTSFTVVPPAGVGAPSPVAGTLTPTLALPTGTATPIITSTPPAINVPAVPVAPVGTGRSIDLIWNMRGAVNAINVGLALGDGTFRLLPRQEFAGPDWPAYEVTTGDISGDGLTDLIWNRKNEQGNLVVISRANGDGTWSMLSIQEHRGRIWQEFKTLVGDVTGDGRDDLIWNETSASHNRIYAGISDGERALILPNFQDHRVPRWQGFQTLVGDVNGDGRDDLIWNETIEEHNRLYVGLSNGDGSFVLPNYQEQSGRRWQGFKTLVGDVNGDGRDDLIWNETRSEHNRTYVGLARGDGTFDFLPYQDRAEPGWLGYNTVVGDVNGDSRTDLVWNYVQGTVNRFAVGLALGDGTFDFRPVQEQLSADWTFYQLLVGDVTGDGRDDLIWHRGHDDQTQIAVGAAKGDGSFQLLPVQALAGDGLGQAQLLLGQLD